MMLLRQAINQTAISNTLLLSRSQIPENYRGYSATQQSSMKKKTAGGKRRKLRRRKNFGVKTALPSGGTIRGPATVNECKRILFQQPPTQSLFLGEIHGIKPFLFIQENGVSQRKELPGAVEIGTLRDANGSRFSAQETDTDPLRELGNWRLFQHGLSVGNYYVTGRVYI